VKQHARDTNKDFTTQPFQTWYLFKWSQATAEMSVTFVSFGI